MHKVVIVVALKGKTQLCLCAKKSASRHRKNVSRLCTRDCDRDRVAEQQL